MNFRSQRCYLHDWNCFSITKFWNFLGFHCTELSITSQELHHRAKIFRRDSSASDKNQPQKFFSQYIKCVWKWKVVFDFHQLSILIGRLIKEFLVSSNVGRYRIFWLPRSNHRQKLHFCLIVKLLISIIIWRFLRH